MKDILIVGDLIAGFGWMLLALFGTKEEETRRVVWACLCGIGALIAALIR